MTTTVINNKPFKPLFVIKLFYFNGEPRDTSQMNNYARTLIYCSKKTNRLRVMA